MKFKILCLALFLVVNTGFSQKSKQPFKADFNTYTELIMQQKFEESLDYMNPGIFEIVVKEELVKIMKSSMNDPSIEITLYEGEVYDNLLATKHDGVEYFLFSFLQPMNMKFVNSGDVDTQAEEDDSHKYLLQIYKEMFGQENVSYVEDTDSFNINSKKKCLASKGKNDKNWFFATIEDGQEDMQEKFIPEPVMQQIKNIKI